MTEDEINRIADIVAKRIGGNQPGTGTKAADEAARLRVDALLQKSASDLTADDRAFLAQQIKLAGY